MISLKLNQQVNENVSQTVLIVNLSFESPLKQKIPNSCLFQFLMCDDLFLSSRWRLMVDL